MELRRKSILLPHQQIWLSVILVLSILLQQILIFNPDVSWLSQASLRLLHGGTYSSDFFENNPPLILYLYFPAAILAEITHLHIIQAMQIYIYSLIILSLYVSNILCHKIFTGNARYLVSPVVISIAIIMLIVPNRDFAQREHLLLILTFPYMLLLVARLSQQTVSHRLAILVGIMAACGFFLKPYFLMGFCAFEFYYMLQTKNWQSWSRTEIRSMFLVLAMYLFVVLIRHEDYITYVMPYAVSWAMKSALLPFAAMVNNGLDGFYLLSGMLYLYYRNKLSCKTYADMLALGAFVYYIVYLLQQITWTYHLYPSLAALLLLLSYIFIHCIHYRHRYDAIAMGLYVLAIILLYHHHKLIIWTASTLYPMPYIAYFAIFSSLYMTVYFYIHDKSHVKMRLALYATIAIMLASTILLDIVNKSEWSLHQFAIMNIFIVTSLSLLIASICHQRYVHIVTFIAFVMTFSLPFFMIITNIDRGIHLKKGMQDLIVFLQNEGAHKSVNIFTTELSYAFPLILYGNDVSSASRFSFLLGLDGMLINKQAKSGDSMFFTNLVVEDIKTKTPDFIFVDNREVKVVKPYMKNNKLYMENIPFDYLDYFKANEQFTQLWQHYTFLKTINRFDIYKRTS